MTRQQPPPPLEWHPWYRDKTWLLDWLERQGPYAELNCVRVIVPQPLNYRFAAESSFTEPFYGIWTMTRTMASAPAPYVGRPFVYAWPVAVDDLGRYVAGEAQRVYRWS